MSAYAGCPGKEAVKRVFVCLSVHTAVVIAKPLEEFTRFVWWMQTEHRVAANLKTKPTNLACETAEY